MSLRELLGLKHGIVNADHAPVPLPTDYSRPPMWSIPESAIPYPRPTHQERLTMSATVMNIQPKLLSTVSSRQWQHGHDKNNIGNGVPNGTENGHHVLSVGMSFATEAESEAALEQLRSYAITQFKGKDLIKSNQSDKQFSTAQAALMKFDPRDNTPKPYPSNAQQFREYHGQEAWLFNPWTGQKRFPGDIGTDVMGHLIASE